MQKKIEILKKCPLFDGIKEDDLLRMLTCFGAKQEFFDKKYTIFAEGTPAKYINPWLINFLSENDVRTGILIVDFATTKLISTIYGRNF